MFLHKIYIALFILRMKNVNYDVAYDHLRRKFANGSYAPGRLLKTNDLSSEIGVSRTPVREALRRLEADGLVVIRARSGASVKSMDLAEYRELCGMRLALESYAAGLAAVHRSNIDLVSMRVACDAMGKLTEILATQPEEDLRVAELRREDIRFHVAIMTAAKSDLLKKEILRLHLISRVVSGPAPGASRICLGKEERTANLRAVSQSHEEIFHAIETKDASAAKSAMEKHIQEIINKNVRVMALIELESLPRELTDEELIDLPQ